MQEKTAQVVPHRHIDLEHLIAVDGSLINATLSMHRADYRKGAKKATAHIGFDLNRGISGNIFLTHGNGAERSFVGRIMSPGDTSVIDRGYQCHEAFDQRREDDLLLMYYINAKTVKTVIEAYPVASDGIVFYDALVLLGAAGINQTKIPLRLVWYNEKVSIKRVRQLRIQIQNELRITGTTASDNMQSIKEQCPCDPYAKT